MKYTITRKLLTNTEIVKYNCPDCAAALWHPLTQAGIHDRCPNCSVSYVVPGKDEIDRRKSAEQSKRQADLAARAEHEARLMREEDRLRAAKLAAAAELVKKRREQKQRLLVYLQSGGTFFVYITEYIETEWAIDDRNYGAINIKRLQVLGAEGFDVVQAIPKTLGVTLQNVSLNFSSLGDKVHAGGVGGNVVGAHVVLRKKLRVEDVILDRDDFLESYLESIAY